MIDTTLITTFTNGYEALRLLFGSFSANHPGNTVYLLAGNSESTDPRAVQLAAQWGTVVNFRQGVGHALVLNDLCRRVTTPYTLVMDFDVEVLSPFLDECRNLLDLDPLTVCVALPEPPAPKGFTVGKFGVFDGVERINPCCALFKTNRLQQILGLIGWETCINFNTRTFFEVGSMLRKAVELSGQTVYHSQGLANSVHHYGQIGALVGGHDLAEGVRPVLEQRYAEITAKAGAYSMNSLSFKPCPSHQQTAS